MRTIVVLNNALARITLEGEVETFSHPTYAARGKVRVRVEAKTIAKDRFIRKFYEGLFGSDYGYEEAREEFGADFLANTDDMLPDLSKPQIRIYSKTLCEWKDPNFTIDSYDEVWNEEGMECGEESEEAKQMRIASGDGSAEVLLDMVEQAKTIEALFLSDRLQWLPTIDLTIGVFFDFQDAQGEGSLFKTVSFTLSLCPAPLPLQAIVLDAAAHRYRLIAGPAEGTIRFLPHPKANLKLTAEPTSMLAGCVSSIVTWDPATAGDLLARDSAGQIARGLEALICAQSAYYRIEIKGGPAGDEPIKLTHDTIADFDALAMKMLEDGTFSQAKEAALSVEDAGEHDLWAAVVIGEPYQRHVVLSIDQAKGARAARNNSQAVLTSPDDFILHRTQSIDVKLKADALELKRTLLLSITLPRWFPLEGSDEETHLRTNQATLLQGLRDAIARYNAANGLGARFNVAARDGFDKVRAGTFLFGHNPPDAIGRTYYFTQPEEVESNGAIAGRWLTTLYGVPAPTERPQPLTEASLLVRMLERRQSKGEKLTPGDVFGLGLEETGGDIGAALLICHNTMRSLARDGGDGLRTGIFALEKERFDKLFMTIRGGYRCTDGFAGAAKDEHCAQANFANDNAGPWYHYFGTAFYGVYTATPDGQTATSKYWAPVANAAEQVYREYAPWSWQDPDPEKELVNCWGIDAGNELLKEHPWMQE